jgi:hypothetical protein
MRPRRDFSHIQSGKRLGLAGGRYRSKWEANVARYLDFLKSRGEISDWKHEPKTYWFKGIKRGTVSWLPDFGVVNKNGTFEIWEVKGYMDRKSQTQLSRMARYYPNIKIVLVGAKEYNEIRKWSKLIPGWED